MQKIINIASFSRSRLNQDPKAGSYYGWHSQFARKTRGVAGAETESWSIDAALTEPTQYERDGVVYRLFPSRWYVSPGREISTALLGALRREAKEHRIIVHLHDYHNWQSYAITLALGRIPVVAHYHGATRRPTENLRMLSRWPFAPMFLVEEAFERAAVRRIRHFFVPNTQGKAYYAGRGKPYTFCPMAPEPGVFRKIGRDAACREIGAAGANPIILNVGGFSPVKNLELLVHAFALLRKNTNASLYIIGPTYRSLYRAHMERLIARLGLLPDVRIVGMVPRERLNAYYNAADVLAITSTPDEGGPTVLLESLMVGLPVVTTPVGFVPDFVGRADGMITVTDSDPGRFASALIEAVLRPDRRSVTAWTWDDVRHAVEPVYEALF